MKRLELDLDGVRKHKDVLARVKDLVDFPDWEDDRTQDWLSTIAAHQGAVPHLQCDGPEGFSVALVNSSVVSSSAMLSLVRWVVKVNEQAAAMGIDPPLAVSIE